MGAVRRALMVLPGALAIGVGAAAAAPHPSATVQSAKVSGGSVAFTVEVTFPVPAGVPAGRVCSGKVTLSAKAGGRTHRWKAPAIPAGTACRAPIHGKLPKALFGKAVAFRFAYPGNASIKPFSRSATLKLSHATGPTGGVTAPSYVNGRWFGNLTYPMGGRIEFTVTKGVIQKNISNSTNGFMLSDCNDTTQTVQMFYGYDYQRTVGVLPGGTFSGRYRKRAPPDPTGSGSGQDMNMSVSGTLGRTTGTITLSAAGTIYGGDGMGHTVETWSGCHGTATVSLYKSP